MKIRDEELAVFRRVGSVQWDSVQCKMIHSWEPDVPRGYVVYLMVLDGEVLKGGKAEDTAQSTFTKRMISEFATARQVIVGPAPGRPLARWRQRPLDPFKEHAPRALLTGRPVDLYARSLTTQLEMELEELRINTLYRGLWTKAGRSRAQRVANPLQDE